MSNLKIVLYRYSILIIISLNLALLMSNLLFLSMLPKQSDTAILIRSEILAQKLQNQNAQILLTDLQATEKDRELINTSLPNKSELVQVIEMLENLRTDIGVKSFSFESEEPLKDENGLFYLPMNLVLEGTLEQTIRALSTIQRSPYLITIILTQVDSPEGISGTLTARVRLSLYVKQPFTENQ